MRNSRIRSSAVGTLLGILLSTGAASAAILYSNGSPDGQSDAWIINYGHQVGDSFTLSSAKVLTGVDFLAWNFAGDSIYQVDWKILGATPPGGGSIAAGSALVASNYQYTNSRGYDINLDSFVLPNLSLPAGTYWLLLSGALVGTGEDTAYWDINGGPSSAWDSYAGDATTCSLETVPSGRCSTSFDITGHDPAVPEPGTLGLVTAALTLLGAAFSRRLISRKG